MDVIDQFNALAPKFALLACQLASEVQQLSDTGDIKALKEDRCHWSSEQRQSLQEFLASKTKALEKSINFAHTYQEYFSSYFAAHPHTLQDLRWSVYGLLEAGFFNSCQLRWLMNLVIRNVPEPDRSGVVNFYNSCVILSLQASPADIHPHCFWLFDHLSELMPSQMFSLLWQLHRRHMDTAALASLYHQVYNSCRVDFSLISAIGFVASLPLVYMLLSGGKGAEFVVYLVVSLAVFILPLVGIYVFRPRHY